LFIEGGEDNQHPVGEEGSIPAAEQQVEESVHAP
jgi:hypothetical protein